ncbi:MAG: MOSC domain-containing protein [Actinobacteria bacterium 13_2_20CM_2_71_6]|nr:MAG: MOSC domain-containing protein [Actinobacteria bacterium 13_2_20CM_2_71_6]
MRLASIHTYPVKSFHRLDHDVAQVEPWGLAGDRRWLVTDDAGRMITQREEPRLTQLQPSYVDGDLVLTATGRPEVRVAAEPGELVEVSVFSAPVLVSRADPAADDWLSEALDRKLHLVYLDDPTRRAVQPGTSRPEDRVTLADEYPLLLTNTASLDVLNDWIAEGGSDEGPLPMTRFRPNLVVTGAPAWAEDGWIGRRVRIGAVTFRPGGNCARCVIPTTDQETGERGKEPSRTLARYRNVNQRMFFGLHLIPDDTGAVRVGDEVTVID